MRVELKQSKLWNNLNLEENKGYNERLGWLKDQLIEEGNYVFVYDGSVESEVLRALSPNHRAIYCVTGVELPNVLKLIEETLTTEDYIIKPLKGFGTTIAQYGYPVISPAVSQAINNIRTSNFESVRCKEKRALNPRHHHLLSAPFPISGACCVANKKEPYLRWAKSRGLPVLLPNSLYTKFDFKPVDTLQFILDNNIMISDVYLTSTHFDCSFCLYNILSDRDRLTRLKTDYPSVYSFVGETLGLNKVWAYLGKHYGIKY